MQAAYNFKEISNGIELLDSFPRPSKKVREHTPERAKTSKTYNSGYSLVVTHLTTNPPVHCLSTAERTGSSIFSVLWSYVLTVGEQAVYNAEATRGCRSKQRAECLCRRILRQRDVEVVRFDW
jgi:hypothetical protein